MPSENEPILTQEGVDDLLKRNTMPGAAWGVAVKACNTITEAVELLREPCTCSDGNNTHRDSMGAWICESCHRKESFLARYEGKEPTQENAK